MLNQEPASAGIFVIGPVRVSTQGLFRPYLKTFVAHFLPTQVTAPGSPRMTLALFGDVWGEANNMPISMPIGIKSLSLPIIVDSIWEAL